MIELDSSTLESYGLRQLKLDELVLNGDIWWNVAYPLRSSMYDTAEYRISTGNKWIGYTVEKILMVENGPMSRGWVIIRRFASAKPRRLPIGSVFSKPLPLP